MFRVCRRLLTCICPMTAKSVSTCSNSTVCDRFWTNRFSDNFSGNRRWFIPVSLLSILNRFHTFLWFHCWFWTIKCQPGGVCFVKRKFQIAGKQVWITFSSIIDSQWEVGDKWVKKRSFFRKFGVLCILATSVLRFALLPYYRRIKKMSTIF